MAARPGRILRALALSGGGALLLLTGLVLETSPRVADSPPPTGAEVRAGRQAFGRLRGTLLSSYGGALTLSREDLAAVTRMAGRGFGLRRTRATLADDRVELAASLALPAGLWLNLSASAMPAASGFPPMRLAAGDLVLSGLAARAAAEVARWGLLLRGVDLPPLGRLAQGLTISPAGLSVQLVGGMRQTGMVQDVLALGGGEVDETRVGHVLCQLVAQQQARPSDDLAVHVQRMLAMTGTQQEPSALVAEHRNALVALALFTAGKGARRLVADQTLLARCAPSGPAVQLTGRPDLAKHWTVSAALAAVGGLETGRLLGEWKELADSMAGGSGFSFVDLAADRAGLQVGRAAVDPARAMAVRAELAGIRNERLLPPTVLALAEGLPNDRFVASYRDTDSRRFAAAVRAIDRMLARGGTPGTSPPRAS